ncbi:MAG: metallophosphoesterase [Patescibacteria group bacterium]|nr:metallophosphoesterase [Patescibacteria group bacterium]
MSNAKKITIALALVATISYSFVIFSGDSAQPNDEGCRIIALGHLYSLQPYPELQELLVEHLNSTHPDASAIVSLGDNTVQGTSEEWQSFFEKYEGFDAPLYFAPGNHDLRTPAAYDNYMEQVGYTSKKVSINNCNLILTNTVSPHELDFNDVEMVKGGGLDDASIALLEGLDSTRTDEADLLLMHHSLFSIGLIHHDNEWDTELNRIYENEKVWREEIQPLIKDRVDAVFAGDMANSAVSHQEIDGIPYVGNSFGSAFDPDPRSDRRPLSYTVVNVDGEGNIETSIEYLPIPVTSDWFAFDRDRRFEGFADQYDDGYDRKEYRYPNR